MIENIPLFDMATVNTLTAQQIIDAVENGVNPFTGEKDYGLADELHDAIHDCWREVSTSIGTFESVTNWSGGDGHEMGIVVRHVETDQIFMKTGTYSSWDSNDWDGPLFKAEPYSFSETRYRAASGS